VATEVLAEQLGWGVNRKQ